MIKWLSNLLTRSGQVKNETVSLANTALRVGTLLEDLAKSTPMEWDPGAVYEAGQVAYFNDIRVKAVGTTEAGQSPITHPLKWSTKLVTDADQITPGNNLPVSAAAVHQLLDEYDGQINDIPHATEDLPGIARKGSDNEINEGVVDDAFTTPKQLKNYFQKFYENYIKPTLTQVLQNGNVGEHSIILSAPAGQPNPQTIYRQTPGSPQFQGTEWQDATGTINRAWFAVQPDGQVVIIHKGKLAFILDENRVGIAAPVFNANDSRGIFRGLSTTALNVATTGANRQYYTPDYDPTTGEYRLMVTSLAEMFQQGLSLIDKSVWGAALAPWSGTTVSLPGDSRPVLTPVYCIPELIQLNEQYITLDPATFGTNQPHELNTPGSGIDWNLKATAANGKKIDASYAVSISFETPNTYKIINEALEPDATYKLYLRKEVFGPVTSGNGTRYVVPVSKINLELAVDPAMGQNANRSLYYVPAGFASPTPGTIITPLGDNWEPYTGLQSALSTDCGITTPPPVTGAPVWNEDKITLPPLLSGAFSYKLPSDAVTTGDGSAWSLTDNPHPFLHIVNNNGWIIYGNIPTGITWDVYYGLNAVQADGKTTPYTLAFPPVTPETTIPIYVLWRQYGSGNNRVLQVRFGGDFGANTPYGTLTGPAGFTSTGRIVLKAFGVDSGGLHYSYELPTSVYNAPVGTYYLKYETASGIRYAQFTIDLNATNDNPVSLETVAPTPVDSTPPTSDPNLPVDNSIDQSLYEPGGYYQTGSSNNPPVVNTPMGTVSVDQGLAFTKTLAGGVGSITDPDGDALSYSLEYSSNGGASYSTTLPGWMSQTFTTYGGTPPVTGGGVTLKLRRKATDPGGLFVYDTFDLILQPGN